MQKRLWIAATVLLFSSLVAVGGLAKAPPRSPHGDLEDRTQFLFFAVLEGLYEDGVQPEVTVAVVPPDDPTPAVEPDDPGTFVYGCPICMPVRDAFRVYAKAPDILGWTKGRSFHRGFGPGLPDEQIVAFTSPDRETRLKALEALVGDYIRRRFERLQMTGEERERMQGLLEEGRKQGMACKPRQFGERCPSCEGSVSGCVNR